MKRYEMDGAPRAFMFLQSKRLRALRPFHCSSPNLK